jgi:hypothetical protein
MAEFDRKRERLKSAEENAFKRSNKFMSDKAQAQNLNEMADSLSELEDVSSGISNLNKNFETLLKNIEKNGNLITNKETDNKVPFEFTTPPILEPPKNFNNENAENKNSSSTIDKKDNSVGLQENSNINSIVKSIIENIQIGKNSSSFSSSSSSLNNNNSEVTNTAKIDNTNAINNPIPSINDLDNKLIKIELPFDEAGNSNSNFSELIPQLSNTNNILQSLSDTLSKNLNKTLDSISNTNKDSINVNPVNSVGQVIEKETINNTIREIKSIDNAAVSISPTISSANLSSNNLENDSEFTNNLIIKTNTYFQGLQDSIDLLSNNLLDSNSKNSNSIPQEILDAISLSPNSKNSNNVDLNNELDKKIFNIQNLMKILNEQEESINKNIAGNSSTITSSLNNISNVPEEPNVAEIKNVSNVNNINSISEKNISNEENILNKISELVNSLNEKNILQKDTVSELISKVSNVKTDEKTSISDIKNVFSDIVKNIEKNTINTVNSKSNVLNTDTISNTISDVSNLKNIKNTISEITKHLFEESNKSSNISNIDNIKNQNNTLNERSIKNEDNISNKKNSENNSVNVLTDVKKILNSIDINSKTKVDEFITDTKKTTIDNISTVNSKNESNTIIDTIKELSNTINNENILNTTNKQVENLINKKNSELNSKNLLNETNKDNISNVNSKNSVNENIITKSNTNDVITEFLQKTKEYTQNETNISNIENRSNVLVDESNLQDTIKRIENTPIELNSIMNNDNSLNNNSSIQNPNTLSTTNNPIPFDINAITNFDNILDKFNTNLDKKSEQPLLPIDITNPLKNTNLFKELENNNNNLISKKTEQSSYLNVLQNIANTLSNIEKLGDLTLNSAKLDTANPSNITSAVKNNNTPNSINATKTVETNTSSNSVESIKNIEQIIENNRTSTTSDNLIEIKKLNSNISNDLPNKLGLALNNNNTNNNSGNNLNNNISSDNSEIKIDTSKLEEISKNNIDIQTDVLNKLLALLQDGINVKNFEPQAGPIVMPFQNAPPRTEYSTVF